MSGSPPPADPTGPARRRPFPLYQRVLLGVTLGATLGVALHDHGWVRELDQVGVLVIRLLKALATPLILFAILDAFLRTRVSARQGGRLIAICLFNVSVAFALGLFLMNTLQPGLAWRDHLKELMAEVPAAELKRAPEGTSLDPLKNLSGYIPESLVQPFLENKVITIVLCGVLAGAALRRLKDLQPGGGIRVVEQAIETILEALIQMLEWIIQLVPLAVFAVVAAVVARSGLGVFAKLWVFLATMLLGLGLHCLVYYPLMAWLVGKRSPREYLGKGADAIVTGLSTNSSLATVPVTLRVLTEKLRVSPQSARLSACVGTNLNNDGITLYEAMAALFLAQAVGYDLSLPEQFVVVLASLMAGVGVAGIPEAGLIVLPLVLGSAGLPESVVIQALPLIMTVDWIIARCRSGVNVMSDMLVAILLDAFRKPEELEEELHGEGDLAPDVGALLDEPQEPPGRLEPS
ncbi:MAG: dicarboxylate/amino acid:cation symporter [Candidatus Eremiobacterota bacterium]